MSNRRSYVLVGLAIFMVAVAMRTIPLYWSPLPFNTDGFHHAALARETIKHGHLPISKSYFNPDEVTFAMLLTAVGQLTSIPPLYIAQILTASIGGVLCLFVVVITRRVGEQLQWSGTDIQIAAVLAGLMLATEGVFLGRSTAVSSEGVGHLFVIMSLLVFAHALWTARSSWILLTGLIFLMLPLTHNLSTVVAGFSAASMLALYLRESITRLSFMAGIFVVVFWIYTGVYYTVFELNEVSRISSVPGLFVAWVIVLVMLTLWLSTTRPRFQRDIPIMVLFCGISLLFVSYFVPIFPGTATAGQLTLLFILPIAAIGGISTWGIPSVLKVKVDGYSVFALLIGTLSLIGFALTASLTVQYQDLAIRSQTFIHIAFAVVTGLGAITLGKKWNSSKFKVVIVVCIIVCSVASAPLAFAGLRATSAQPLVTQSEFETATFAVSYTDSWTSDGHMTRIALKYYPEQTSDTVLQRPVYDWLHSGTIPKCPVVSQQSWTTVGVQLFPSSPKKIRSASYRNYKFTRNTVYSASGNDPLFLTVQRTSRGSYC